MAKVSIRQSGVGIGTPSWLAGNAMASAYFDEGSQHLSLYQIAVPADGTVRIESGPIDRVGYVWHGSIEGGGHVLDQGSSFIVERGEAFAFKGRDEHSEILVFSDSKAGETMRSGGHVHLLPSAEAPRSDNMGGSPPVSGVMHANGECPTCEVWLHENHFPPGEANPEHADTHIHSHTEDEIIFVTEGEMRLGAKLFPPGTALAIRADTFYGFTPGPNGLKFVNFRAHMPGDIIFANGPSISEPDIWRHLPRPTYRAPRS